MKKIFWRVVLYFGVVLVVFTALIGLLFTQFNRNNITGSYRESLTNLGTGVASRVSRAHRVKKESDFTSYMKSLADFTSRQDTDVWVIAKPAKSGTYGETLEDNYTNIDIDEVTVSDQMRKVIDAAFNGKKKSYIDYDKNYEKEMMHVGTPIRADSGAVMGAVVVSGPMNARSNTVRQYQKYMFFCMSVGFLLALFLAFVFSRQIVRPILRLNVFAKLIATGDYVETTGIVRNDELGSLADSMDDLAEQLDEAEQYRQDVEKSRQDFFSNVSHELRTPITVTKGYADALMEGYVDDPEKRADYLRRIQSECVGMERLVSDLLILSRMQNPDFEMEMDVINIIAVAQDALRGLTVLMKEKGLTGEVTYDDERSLIDGDYDRIRQVFVVLLQNAIKYCDENTKLSVHIGREDAHITASVNDHGALIPKTEWDSVFEKFYRASTHGKREGSGLGLMVAKNIVKKHGGTISVTSDEENGTTFFMIFPETNENILEF